MLLKLDGQNLRHLGGLVGQVRCGVAKMSAGGVGGGEESEGNELCELKPDNGRRLTRERKRETVENGNVSAVEQREGVQSKRARVTRRK